MHVSMCTEERQWFAWMCARGRAFCGGYVYTTFAVCAAAPGDNVRRVRSMETKASRWICRTRANLDETRATTLYFRL